MGNALLRPGRIVTVALVGIAFAIGLTPRARDLSPNAALAAGVDGSGTPDSPDSQSTIGDRVTGNLQEISQSTDDADTLELIGLQAKFQSVVKRVAPAVVSISAAETASDSDSTLRAEEMNPQRLQSLLDKTTRTIGTGFIVDPDGFIVTNQHVIEDSQQFWVTTDDRKVYPAIVVAADPRADLAVLKIPASNLPVVRFASGSCQRGQWAETLGNPYGLATEGDMALSVGVVSATDRSLPRLATKEDRLYSNLIQTTAQINPGNSGGPLLDVSGNVIGINTAVILPQKQTNGIGFALTITPELLSEIRQLEQGRETIYGYMGVTVAAPTPLQRKDAGLTDSVGVWIESVEPVSPAQTCGLKAGDMILEVNGQPVINTDRFVRLVGAAQVGQPAEVVIVRDAKKMRLGLTPVKRPMQYAVTNQNQRMYWRGMVLGPVPANWPMAVKNAQLLAGILVVGIDDDNPLKRQGISAGSVITAIAGHPVATLIQLQQIVNDVPLERCTLQTASETEEVAAARK